MAKDKKQYTSIGAEWLTASEAVGQARAYLDCDYATGLHNVAIAVQSRHVTKALLHLPDDTTQEVDAHSLLNDPGQLGTNYNKKQNATVYLARPEIDRLWPKRLAPITATESNATPITVVAPSTQASPINDYDSPEFKALGPLVQLCVRTMDDMGPGILDRSTSTKNRSVLVNKELGKLECPRTASLRIISDAAAFRRQHRLNK